MQNNTAAPDQFETKKLERKAKIKKKRREILIVKGIFFVIGFGLSLMLYFQCLHNNTLNNYVVIFFCIIALGCFSFVGLPIDTGVIKDKMK